MRAFVATVPPTEALVPLVEKAAELRERWPRLGWVAPERWHLTLCFLGQVEEGAAASIRSELARVARGARPIRAAMSTGGTFPGGSRPRVVWVAVEAGPELEQLADQVVAVAGGAGLKVDSRRHRAHITVARARREPPHDPEELRRALDAAQGRPFTIDRLLLYRSHLGPKPRYEEVDAWLLGKG